VTAFLVAALLVALAIPAAAQAPPLTLEARIPLERTSGRIDHMAYDARRGRLLVAELGNGTVDAVDVEARKVVARIGGLREPQGIGHSEAADIVAVASAGDGTVRFYRGGDLSPLGAFGLGDDADNVRVDRRTGRFVVGYGAGALAVVDPVTRTKTTEFRLPGHPESFQLDPARGLAFVNVPDARQVSVVDLSGALPPTAWRVPGGLGNFPMAYDADRREVAIITRNPPALLIFDASTGQVKARAPACGDADDAFFDPKRARLYVSCGAGQVGTWRREGDHYAPLPPVRTASGARTALFVPQLDRLFVAQRAGLLPGSGAAILIFRPVGGEAAR
jgi:hypothetical protein